MSAYWIEPLLYVAAGAVGAIYTFQVIWPKVRQMLPAAPTADERAAELLQRYRRAQEEAQRQEEEHPEL